MEESPVIKTGDHSTNASRPSAPDRPGVSVVICCHNSARRLPETLRHLSAQNVPSGIEWEVVVVDNASTDATAETARRGWPADAPAVLRVVPEPEAGLSHARIRGIEQARYEIISFIDDDNWAAPNWIERVAGIFSGHPEIGACGGKIEAVFETPSPAWFASVQGYYAVGSQHPQNGDITERSGTLLCGAGLSLRTNAVRQLLKNGFVFRMTGRKGGRLLTGEDTELCYALRASGWRFWYDETLLLRHFIPAERLSWDYVVRLMRGAGDVSPLFTLYLFALNGPPFDERYPAWKKTWFFQTLKSLQHLLSAFGRRTGPSNSPEAALRVLKIERLKRQAATWWSMRGQWQSFLESIEKSAWAQKATRRE